MYTAFYGLREKPFALSPDPRFLYLAASHREALAHLLYGIEQGEGFISVTGEVGTGKTTLCRTLLERLEGDIELAFLFNPSRSALELLQSICAEFGLPAEGLGRRNLMSQLNRFLLQQKERGRRVLLIIDEAQTLSENTLEQVRLLSNLETSREKLIQILLLGQPELDRKLDERGLRQLRQRISVRWTLEPLGADETLAYVRHRIAIAAGQPKDLFTESALREVHRRTGGIPRLVNQLCDRALLAGYAARAAQIGPALIRAAAREIPDVRDPRDRSPRGGRALLPGWLKRPWMYFALTLAFVGASLAGGLAAGRSAFGGSLAGARAGQAHERPGHAESSGRPADLVDSSGLPAVGAASNAAGGPGDAPSIGSSPYVGRLLGYVTDPDQIIDGAPGGEGGATGAASGATSSGMPDARANGATPAALRATDAQLAAVGLSADAFSLLGPATQTGVAGGVTDPAALAALRRDAASSSARSAVAPGAFAQLLGSRTSAESLAESERAFLDLYDLPASGGAAPDRAGASGPGSAEELQRRLEARGLMATAFDGGNFAMLRRLDHPVLIPVALEKTNAPAVAVPEADRRWLALTGFEGNRAWLAGVLPGRVVSVDLDELAPRWLEAGVLVWKNHERLATRVERGAAATSVRWLQKSLAELGHYSGRETGQFDAATAAALRDFQTTNDIVEDGIVGPLTQIALYGKLTRYPVPRLSLAGTPDVAAPPKPAALVGASG